MTAVMYGFSGDGTLVEMRETRYDREIDLQDFLSRHPALLAGDQMNTLEPRRFVLITPEAGIAIAKDGSDYFSLDHLFIDQDGIPTLVEVKRSTDARLRREVIGQLLEYAANACEHWDVGRLRSAFEQRCAKSNIAPEAELSKLEPSRDVDQEALWAKMAQNLEQGRLRLVFVADSFSPDTQRIIEFLNRQMELTEVYAVEVRQYVGGGMRTLAPRVLNTSVLQTDRRAASSDRGDTWTPDRFYSALRETSGQQAVDLFHKIHDWAEQQPHVAVFFGRGKKEGSIQVTFMRNPAREYRPGEDVVFLTLWTYGRVEIDFQYLMTTTKFRDLANREELRQRLTSASTIAIPEDKVDKRPGITWSELTDPNNMRALLTSQDWVVAELSSSR